MNELNAANDRVLVSMAILEVNWNTDSKSYLDNFVPFVVEALLREREPEGDAEFTKSALQKHFGLNLPISIVRSIRKRAVAAGHAERGLDGSFRLLEEARDLDRNISEDQSRLLRQQQSLVAALRLHVREKYSVEWQDKDSRAAIFDYVDRHASKLLSAATRGEASPVWDSSAGSNSGTESMVASFVKTLFLEDAEKFEYFVQIVKGSMLASSMYLPAGSDRRASFTNTTLYFDTPLLLAALGYDGDVSRAAVSEVVSLARSQGARVATFPHVVRETRGVLQGASNRLRFRATREARRSVDNFLAESGLEPSDVLAAADSVAEDLAALSIEVDETPGREQHFFSVSETDLLQAIVDGVYYSRPENNGPQRDIDSITAVYRLRGGREGDRLETSRAVFVTTNRALIDVVKRFPDFARQGWPIAVHVDQVASILWLKEPTSAPDLPRNQVIADCLALLTPKAAIWNDYMDRVDRLLERGELSEEQVLLMRSTIESQAALMAETRGGAERLTDTTVLAVLSRLEDSLQAPLREELKAANSQVENLRQRSARELAEADRRDAELRKLASANLEAEARLDRARRRVSGIAAGLALFVRIAGVFAILLLTLPYFVAPMVASGRFDVGADWPGLLSALSVGLITVVGAVWRPGQWIQRKVAESASSGLYWFLGIERTEEDGPASI